MKNISILSILTILLFGCGPEEKKIIIDIPGLKGKTQEEVVQQLGTPDTTHNRVIMGRSTFTQIYQPYDTEIKYKDGKISSIIVNSPRDLKFNEQVIGLYGFTQTPANLKDSTAFFNWNDLDSIANISVYKVETNPDQPDRIAFKIYFNME